MRFEDHLAGDAVEDGRVTSTPALLVPGAAVSGPHSKPEHPSNLSFDRLPPGVRTYPPTLLMDLYELTMAQSYFDQGMDAPATFSLFARHLPSGWGYFVAAGLADVQDYLEAFAFNDGDLAYLESTQLFRREFLSFLRKLRFTGAVRALLEGTVFFPDEPVLEVTAPIIEAQIVETALLNQVHFQVIIASKAARCVQAAHGRRLVEFGLRRTHGSDAGLKVARSTYLAGFDATSNVLAGQLYGIPIAGTMAHSYIQAVTDEREAYRAYARSFPDACLLLIDTYDTIEGARLASAVGQELATAGHRLRGVRLDSGDLIGLSTPVRRILDDADLTDATIFVSGSIDERLIAEAVARNAPIDAFGVGTRIGVSADAPYLDMAYKLVTYAGRPVLKLSAGKATWPGPKQIWRVRHETGAFADWLTLVDEPAVEDATPLLVSVMEKGQRTSRESLAEARERARREIAGLPSEFHDLDARVTPPVRFSEPLRQLRDRLASMMRH